MSTIRESEKAKGITLQVQRIGYPDEGIRFVVASGCPYDFHSEIQLSRGDTIWLIAALKEELKRKDLK